MERVPATQKDCEEGRAIFFCPNGGGVAEIGKQLPCKAKYIGEDAGEKAIKKGEVIEVVQAEQSVDGRVVVIGFGLGEQEGICTLDEIELI
jgi:hypothetical protein